jgi:putative heme-binding domain-containing protein
VISDQYQSSIVLTVNGDVLVGLVSEADGKLVIYTDDVKAPPITIASNQVEEMRTAKRSQMPTGLIDGLNPDELRDLLAYLMSGGDPNNKKIYGKK